MVDLDRFMSDNLNGLVKAAYRSVITNPREARFALRFMRSLAKGEKRRAYQKADGILCGICAH